MQNLQLSILIWYTYHDYPLTRLARNKFNIGKFYKYPSFFTKPPSRMTLSLLALATLDQAMQIKVALLIKPIVVTASNFAHLMSFASMF